jgi:hypothetical protein
MPPPVWSLLVGRAAVVILSGVVLSMRFRLGLSAFLMRVWERRHEAPILASSEGFQGRRDPLERLYLSLALIGHGLIASWRLQTA